MAPAGQGPASNSNQPPESPLLSGGCLCGAVRFEAPRSLLSPVTICHCSQCRRFHGHIAAYAGLPAASLVFREDRGLKWYASSPDVRRGFCALCGASLFWRREGGSKIDLVAGSLDAPTGLATIAHIWTASRGDYYGIDDGLPQHGERAPF